MLKVFLVVVVLVVWAGPSLRAETLFYDDFEDGKINDAFQFTGNNPDFVEEDGALSQTGEAVGDTCYAIIADQEYPQVLTIEAAVRIDEWETGAYARTGVGVRVSVEGQGLAFLFSDHRVGKPQTGVSFLDDLVAWGPLETYEWELGTWYWSQLHIDDNGELHAKIWQDGEAEPDDWMWEIAGFGLAKVDGNPGLNASSGTGGGISLASFGSVEVWDEDGRTPQAVEASGKMITTWASIKSNY